MCELVSHFMVDFMSAIFKTFFKSNEQLCINSSGLATDLAAFANYCTPAQQCGHTPSSAPMLRSESDLSVPAELLLRGQGPPPAHGCEQMQTGEGVQTPAWLVCRASSTWGSIDNRHSLCEDYFVLSAAVHSADTCTTHLHQQQ